MIRKRWTVIYGLIVVVSMLPASAAQATDQDDLTALLHEFLAGASAGDIAAHENFWHDDLIYTSSNGTRTNKAEILEAVASSPPGGDGPGTLYTAEDINIRIYGNTAIVAFRLVGTPQGSAADQTIAQYFNTGTFLSMDGVWRVIAWQATRIPEPEADGT